ncbi:hypothetical protein F2Q69_00009520 [Brassica cretica]|uniref:Uncharacterized protein n=1 Tax=Brassica cretica TaxID=69181 RepID=A0A8S9NM30_BRACR|nr:hypothetical protein F2Q69_00009520 [Brassica cretica]
MTPPPDPPPVPPDLFFLQPLDFVSPPSSPLRHSDPILHETNHSLTPSRVTPIPLAVLDDEVDDAREEGEITPTKTGVGLAPESNSENLTLQRSRSLPSSYSSTPSKYPHNYRPSSSTWIKVVHKSSPPKASTNSDAGRRTSPVAITNSQFAEEEELIKSAQAIIRGRLANIDKNPQAFPTALV